MPAIDLFVVLEREIEALLLGVKLKAVRLEVCTLDGGDVDKIDHVRLRAGLVSFS